MGPIKYSIVKNAVSDLIHYNVQNTVIYLHTYSVQNEVPNVVKFMKYSNLITVIDKNTVINLYGL